MSIRLLKSLETGCVLAFTEATLKSPGVREMTAEEVSNYMASLGKPQSIAPVVEVRQEPPAEVLKGVTVTRDISEGELDAEEVLKALEAD